MDIGPFNSSSAGSYKPYKIILPQPLRCNLTKTVRSNVQLSMEDVFGGTPLHDATLGLHADVVKLLVDAGAAVNVCNKKGLPPFFPIQFDQYALDADQLTRYERIIEIFMAAKVCVNYAHPTTGEVQVGIIRFVI